MLAVDLHEEVVGRHEEADVVELVQAVQVEPLTQGALGPRQNESFGSLSHRP
jgi:hypothetical protein